MTAPFTPGPWAIGGKHRATAIDAPGVEVAFARQDYGRIDSTTAEANARLIAAAPDLLAALQGLMPTNLGRLPETMPDSSMLPLDVTFGELRRAIAALAKVSAV